MQVRPFRLVGAAHRERLRALFGETLRQWAEDWGFDTDGVLVAVEEPKILVPKVAIDRPWREQWQGSRSSVWCDWSADAIPEVAELVFPTEGNHVPAGAPGSLASAGAEEAFDELVAAVRNRCFADSSTVASLRSVDQAALRAGSGAAVVVITLRRATLHLMLDGLCAASLLGRTAVKSLPKLEKVALQPVLKDLPVSLGITAGEVEIGAGTLLGLGVGDVIALPVALDHGFAVTLAAGQRLCTAFIGRTGDRMAIEISK